MKRTRAKKPAQWPPFRYEVKEDYIKIINPSGATSKPIPPAASSHRPYEIYKVARECLVQNVRFPLVTARAEATDQDVPQFSIVTPSEYKKIFEALNLHKLLLEVMTIHYPGHPADAQTRHICKVCFRDLTAKQQKVYCSEECRNVWKHRQALERGRKAVRGSSLRSRRKGGNSKTCPNCHHRKAFHKNSSCSAPNCRCKLKYLSDSRSPA